MAKLFVNAICPFAQRAWIAARFKNAPVALEHISLSDMPKWYVETINPRETVPAFQAADGKLVYESMFIAEYLDATYGRPFELFPRNAQVRADIRFFLDVAGNAVGNFYEALSAENAAFAEAERNLQAELARVESLLAAQSPSGPFFLGAQFSLADVAIVPFLYRFNILLKQFHGADVFTNTPRLRRVLEAALAIDAVASTSPTAQQLLEVYKGYAKHPAAPLALPTLYVAATCPFAHRARLAAALTKVPVKREVVDLANPPKNFAELNPRETVPFIIQPDGKKVFESLFVAKYLGELRNDATDALSQQGIPIVPTNPQDVHDADFFVDDFGGAQGGLFAVLGAGAANREQAILGATAALQSIEKRVKGPFVLGAQVSFADVAVLPFLLRYEGASLLVGKDLLAPAPKLKALVAAFKALDGASGDIETAEFYAEALRMFFTA